MDHRRSPPSMNPEPTNSSDDNDDNEDRPPAWHQTVVFDPDAPEWQHKYPDLVLVWQETTPNQDPDHDCEFGVCIFNPDNEKMDSQWVESDHHTELADTR